MAKFDTVRRDYIFTCKVFCFIPTLNAVFSFDRDVLWTFVCGCSSISEAQVKYAETVPLLTDRFPNYAIHSSSLCAFLMGRAVLGVKFNGLLPRFTS